MTPPVQIPFVEKAIEGAGTAKHRLVVRAQRLIPYRTAEPTIFRRDVVIKRDPAAREPPGQNVTGAGCFASELVRQIGYFCGTTRGIHGAVYFVPVDNSPIYAGKLHRPWRNAEPNELFVGALGYAPIGSRP